MLHYIAMVSTPAMEVVLNVWFEELGKRRLGRLRDRLWKVALAATSFAPTLVVYAAVLVMERQYALAAVLVAVALGLWAVCDLRLRVLASRASKTKVNSTSADVVDDDVFGFLLIYLLPLIIHSLGGEFDWFALVVTGAAMVFVTMTGQAYRFQPLLILSGWHFYKLSFEDYEACVLISRQRILNPKARLRLDRLTSNVFVAGVLGKSKARRTGCVSR